MSIFGSGDTITPQASPEGQGADGAASLDEIFGSEDAGNEESGEQQQEQESAADDDAGELEQEPPSGTEQGENLILGKFKSQEDLATAYANLEKEYTRSRQQPQAGTPAAPQQGQQPEPNVNELFWTNMERDALGTINYLIEEAVKQRTAPIYEQRDNETLSRNLSDLAGEFKEIRSEEGMNQLFGRVRDIALEMGNPQLAKSPTPRLLRLAAQELYGATTSKAYTNGKQAAQQAAEAARAGKQQAAVPNGGKARTESQKTEEDDIADSIVSAGKRFSPFGQI